MTESPGLFRKEQTESPRLLGEDTCNLNYAKPFCPSLKPNKSTPKYDYSVKPLSAKHMASHVGYKVGNNLRYSEKYGVHSQRHRKLREQGFYKPVGSEDCESAEEVEETLFRANKEEY